MKNVESGTIVIEIDGVNYTASITDYNATLKRNLTAGEHTVKAYFAETTKYNAAEFGPVTVKVNDKAETTITIDDTTLTIGENHTFGYVINDIADLVNDNVSVTVKGNASATYHNITAGEYEVDVNVTGDDLKLSYESKIKKVKILISESK